MALAATLRARVMALRPARAATRGKSDLTHEEQNLQLYLRFLAGLFFLATAGYVLPALVGPLRPLFVNLPFVTNSAVKVGTLGLLALFASADVRRYRLLVTVIVVAHVISEIAVATVLLFGDTSAAVPVGAGTVPVRTLLLASMGLDAVIIAVTVRFARAADRARYELQYLSPVEFRTVRQLAEALIVGKDERVPPTDCARNVDRYLSRMRARGKWVVRVALFGIEYYPLTRMRAPLSYLRPEERLALLKRHFYQDVALRLVPEPVRVLVQAMIRFGKQLAFLGYYSDPRSFEQVGYVPFSRRVENPAELPAWRQRLAVLRERNRRPLRMMNVEEGTETLRADVVVIGSGAAASVLAHRLTQAGRDVLMLERGRYVDRSRYTEDEVEMLSELYADGALQLSRDFRFQILQGSCVGGTTVVNNAVSFDLPDSVLERWNDPRQLDAGLDPARLRRSFRAVREQIHVRPQDHDRLNPGARYFNDGVRRLGLDQPPNRGGVVEANISGCLGCGYCNIGCQFGAKLSMLETVLPDAQAHAGRDGWGSLLILPDCEALKLRSRGSRVDRVLCRLGNGRPLEVRADVVVVAAGAVSSSIFLLRSGVGGERVGKQLGFNVGSPLTAVFPFKVRSQNGLQISHFLKQEPDPGYILETWWNPPVAQALAMPGWFDDHFANMLRYDRMTGVGVLVASDSQAEVRLAPLTGRSIVYTPTEREVAALTAGLIKTGEIFLAAGAECVLPHTFTYHELRTPRELPRLHEILRDPSNVTLGTGHPQGGNPISRDPRKGVVDQEFRVNGYDNLYVCDASVFPSSIGVNPQLTVMALADYAAPVIAAAR